MKTTLRYLLPALIVALGFFCLHSTGRAPVGLLPAVAATPPACSMNTASVSPLISNYDPITATAATTLTISGGTFTFTCTGLGGSGSTNHVHILASGSSAGYTQPNLVSTNFTLTYSLCVPGGGTCTSTSTFWGTGASGTTDFDFTGGITNGQSTPIPSFSIFLGRQDAFVGTTSNYTGSLFFSFKCGEGSNEVTC